MDRITTNVMRALLRGKVVEEVEVDTNSDYDVCEVTLTLDSGEKIKFSGAGNTEIVMEFGNNESEQ